MDKNLKQADDMHSIPMTSVNSGKEREAAPGVWYYTDQIVNVVFVGLPDSDAWFLVDAGMPNSASKIKSIAEERFGLGIAPQFILLTHGHFDHVGSLVDLLELWPDTPVYAHPMEFPFLTGLQDYPDPDISVEGGMLAKISMIYPHKAIDISAVLRELPADGSVPGFQEWKWIHVPGHTPGQVALFRDSDRTLLAADAFVTVRQDSFYKVLVQKKEVHGPPRYLTTDWASAKASVERLAQLYPQRVVTGHGSHMEGAALTEGLSNLLVNWHTMALPDHGKFVNPSDKGNIL